MKLFDILLPYQKAFVRNGAKRKLWLSARQVGKSFTLGWLSVYKALQRQDGLSLCISTGSRAACELLKKCERFAAAAKALGGPSYQCSADCVRFDGGSRVLSLPSGNPSALRGYRADCVVIDECAFIERPMDVWAAIVPTLTRNPDSELVVASTPAGKSGLFYDLWSGAGEGWYVQTTTVEDAARQGLDLDVRRLKELVDDPEVFSREYMCEFCKQWSSMVDVGLLDFAEKLPGEPAARWLGMDVGSVSDRTAFVTLALCGEDLFVEDVTVMNKASYESQLEAMKALNAKYRYAGGYVDQNGIGSMLAEYAAKQVSARITGFSMTAQSKTPAYERLRSKVFDHGLKFLEKHRDLFVKDFTNVHREVSEAGKVSYSAGRDQNGHSDATSALVLALQAAEDRPARLQAPRPCPRPSVFGPRSAFLI